MLQLDLVCWMQAESVNELVGARTAAAADSAIAGLTGGIGAMVQKLRRSALLLLAELEVRLLHCCFPSSRLGYLPFAAMLFAFGLPFTLPFTACQCLSHTNCCFPFTENIAL